MNKQLNPHFFTLTFLGFLVFFLMIFPISIEVKTNDAHAQDTENSTVVEYTLRTMLGGTPPMAFVGVGGDIDGIMNPTLIANVGDTVRLTVINGDPILHDFRIDEFGVNSGELRDAEQTVTMEFVVTQAGEFDYYCSIPGHREIGMLGKLRVTGDSSTVAETESSQTEGSMMSMMHSEVQVAPAAEDAVSVVHNPIDIPAPVGDRAPMTVQVNLTAQEVTGILADGTTYNYFTFNGTVPGPMLRVRVGDTVELSLTNEDGSAYPHSIDLHAVTGPGGGAVFTQTNPGETNGFTFRALQPGLYVYHCATPSVPHHIASGMYGLILVEPVGGLPPVDREFYVMQGEVYTAQPFGTQGNLDFSYDMMLDEDAEYLVFNGSAGALTQDEFALHANVGETVRIFFGVGGPNYTSSFHVIGEIFDRVYSLASLTSAPLTDVQTTTVAPGGAVMVEFTVDVPGRYILVDHALSRLERGLAGYLYVEGDDQPDIIHANQ